MDKTAADVGENAPKADDNPVAAALTHHQAMLEDHHARLGEVEKHLGIAKEAGVAKEESQDKSGEKAKKAEAIRERRRH